MLIKLVGGIDIFVLDDIIIEVSLFVFLFLKIFSFFEVVCGIILSRNLWFLLSLLWVKGMLEKDKI